MVQGGGSCFPGGLDGKASVCNAGDQGLIPVLGRSPGEGNGNPLQYSCLESPMDRGTWWATVHGVAKSRTRLSYFTYLLREEDSQGVPVSLTEIMRQKLEFMRLNQLVF